MIKGTDISPPLRVAPVSNVSIRKLLIFAFSLLFAVVFTSLPLEAFLDRVNYLEYARASDVILARYSNFNIIVVLANEPLWLLINIGLAGLMQPENVLRTIIFTAAFLVPLQLLRQNQKHVFLLMLLILMPQVLKNHIIHLRQGLGLAVFMLGYFSKSKWFGGTIMLAAGLIHGSFLLIMLIRGLTTIAGLIPLSPRKQVFLQFLGFVLISFSILEVASALGARQGTEYSGVQLAFSGIGFLFWSLVLLIFLSAGRVNLRQNLTAVAILLFYLATYFVLPFAARIFESGLFVVLLGGLSLSGWRKKIFVIHVFTYTVIQYVTNLDANWFGWGVKI